jgi:hypothetical protein
MQLISLYMRFLVEFPNINKPDFVQVSAKIESIMTQVFHLLVRHPGMDLRQAILPNALRVNANLFQTDLCRGPEVRDGKPSSHPCDLDTGSPCRYDDCPKAVTLAESCT